MSKCAHVCVYVCEGEGQWCVHACVHLHSTALFNESVVEAGDYQE